MTDLIPFPAMPEEEDPQALSREALLAQAQELRKRIADLDARFGQIEKSHFFRGKTNQNCSKTRIKYGYSSFRFGYRVGRINNRKVAL